MQKKISRSGGLKVSAPPITKEGCTGKAKALAKTFKKMSKRTKNESAVDDDLARAERLERWIARNKKLAGRPNGEPAGNTSGEPAGGTKEESVGSAVDANAKKNLSSEEIKAIKDKAAEWQGSLGSVGGNQGQINYHETYTQDTRHRQRKLS